MKRKMVLSATALFCGAALICGGAWGQVFKPLPQIHNLPQKPAMQSLQQTPPHSPPTPPSMPAPSAPTKFSVAQWAGAIRQSLRLAALPTLGASVTLTPGKPIIPSIAKVDYFANVTSGNLDNPSDTGTALFCGGAGVPCAALNQDRPGYYGGWWLTFRVQKDKLYAIDCRVTGPTTVDFTAYQTVPPSYGGPMGGPLPMGWGSASNTGLNTVFAVGPAQANGQLAVFVGWDRISDSYHGVVAFYSCDIAPFSM